MPPELPRRTVLTGGLGAVLLTGLAATGCRSDSSSPSLTATPPTPPTPPGAEPAELVAAVRDELALIGRYRQMLERATGSARDTVRLLLRQHNVHLERLTPTGVHQAPATVRGKPSTGMLVAAEQGSARRLARAATMLEDGELAALLAGIGASHAAHVVLLQGASVA